IFTTSVGAEIDVIRRIGKTLSRRLQSMRDRRAPPKGPVFRFAIDHDRPPPENEIQIYQTAAMKIKPFFIPDRILRRERRRKLRDVEPLTEKQQEMLNQVLESGSFNLVEDYDRIVEICRIANSFNDAMEMMMLVMDRDNIVGQLTKIDRRFPFYLELELLDHLSRIKDDENRFAVSSEIQERMDTLKRTGDEKYYNAIETPIVIRSLRRTLSYVKNDQQKMVNRLLLLEIEKKEHTENDTEKVKENARTLALYFVYGDRARYPPNDDRKEEERRQLKILTELMDTCMFEDYDRMVEISKIAKTLDEAIDLMLQ
ncbi:hypothetical protein PFISCL1PPCAC_1600, partial [Pristionchus fissidentatus]